MVLKAICLLVFTAAGAAWVAADDPFEMDRKPDGFESVFNGKDLSGWIVEGTKVAGDDDKPVWTASESVIHCAGHGFGFLRYDREVSDFVLALEYQLERRGNSGIGIRYGKYTGDRKTRPSYAGYEIQLLDDHGKEATASSTGSLYRYVAPSASAARPAGEWNRIVIECRGPRIRITLNDALLHDLDQRSVAEIADKPLKGYFSLQNHGGEVMFRNIQLKELK